MQHFSRLKEKISSGNECDLSGSVIHSICNILLLSFIVIGWLKLFHSLGGSPINADNSIEAENEALE